MNKLSKHIQMKNHKQKNTITNKENYAQRNIEKYFSFLINKHSKKSHKLNLEMRQNTAWKVVLIKKQNQKITNKWRGKIKFILFIKSHIQYWHWKILLIRTVFDVPTNFRNR